MGEIGPDGHPAGAYSLARALTTSQRMQVDRTLLGEVRGHEIWVLLKTLESTGGGMCTTHAARADATIEKLTSCAMEFGPNVTAELATRKLAHVVDVVVQLGLTRKPKVGGGWQLEHWVDEVLAIGPGESGAGLAMTPIFKTTHGDRVARPVTLPDRFRGLQADGFDLDSFVLEGVLEESA